MKKALFIFLMFFSFAALSSAGIRPEVFISSDSITGNSNYYLRAWRYTNQDSSTMALPSYDDSHWREVKSTIAEFGDSSHPFKGISWFRLHLLADSTVTGRPLAMTITHLGASEIYFDGKRIASFGKINGADSSIYYDPQERPFIFMIPDTGAHTIAVRYANYNADKNFKLFKTWLSGFRLSIGESEASIQFKDQRSTILSGSAMLLGGIFYALCLIHLFMFLYNRNIRSNLYFSIFMFSLASCFVIGLICYASHNPSVQLWSFYLLNPLFIFACISLSGFINELFAKGRWRFRFVVMFGIVALVIYFLNRSISAFMTTALVIGVSFEAIFSVIAEMVKRTRGSRIIGAGILFLALFILTSFAIAMTANGNIDVDDSTIGGRIFSLFLVLAILSVPFSMSVYQAWNFSSIHKNLEVQLEQVQVLSRKSIEQEQEKQHLLENKQEELEKEVFERTAELREEKKKSDDLLLNILPAEVAEELKTKGRTDAKTYSMVTVMFTDFKDFTDVSEKISAELLVAEIDYCFSAFDNIIQKYKIEKIKTIGDAYICAAGMPVLNFTNAEDMINAALEIQTFIQTRKKEKELRNEIPFELRIGIHTGPVVAGIVGVKKFAYDIWGDTVNIAARMESSGETGRVNISGSTFQLVKNKFACEHRGKIPAKNKGEIDMYFVN